MAPTLARTAAPLPRTLLETYLQAHALTPAALAAASTVPEACIVAVLEGHYPRDPVALHRLGVELGAPARSWAEHLAAGICGCPVPELAPQLRGRLWVHLLEHGLAPAALATRLRLPPRVLAYLLRSGVVSELVRRSELPALLGCAAGDPALTQGYQRTASTALRELLQRALRARGETIERLARQVELGEETLRALVRGLVPHCLNPTRVPVLAQALGIEPAQLAHACALSWRTRSSNAGTLKYLVIRHCFRHGQPLSALGAQAGVTPARMRAVLLGRTLEAGTCAALRRVLGASDEEWQVAVERQLERRCVATQAYASLAVKPLHTLVDEAIRAAGSDETRWARAIGVRPALVAQILRHGVPVRRAAPRLRLIRALGLDLVRYRAAARRMLESFHRDAHLARVVPRTGLQEHCLRLVRQQGMTLASMAAASGIGLRTAESIVWHGHTAALPTGVLERIRRFLGVTVEDFRDLCAPLGTEGEAEGDAEVRLLRVFRRLQPERQGQLLAIGGRLLADHRPWTLVERAS